MTAFLSTHSKCKQKCKPLYTSDQGEAHSLKHFVCVCVHSVQQLTAKISLTTSAPDKQPEEQPPCFSIAEASTQQPAVQTDMYSGQCDAASSRQREEGSTKSFEAVESYWTGKISIKKE